MSDETIDWGDDLPAQRINRIQEDVKSGRISEAKGGAMRRFIMAAAFGFSPDNESKWAALRSDTPDPAPIPGASVMCPRCGGSVTSTYWADTCDDHGCDWEEIYE